MESLYRIDGDAPEYMEVNITKSKDGTTGGLNYNFYIAKFSKNSTRGGPINI